MAGRSWPTEGLAAKQKDGHTKIYRCPVLRPVKNHLLLVVLRES